MQQLIDLFSKPPAGFVWATNGQGRTLGTSEGFVLDIWTDTVEAAVLFPPDNSRLVRRNTMLCLLLAIFSCSRMMPSITISGRGGQPGMYRSRCVRPIASDRPKNSRSIRQKIPRNRYDSAGTKYKAE